MASATSAALKRSLDESGLCDDGDAAAPPGGKERKLVHRMTPPMPGAKTPLLAGLATEVLWLIASELCTRDLGSLRLTCRTIEAQVFNDFASYYFAKKQFMMTEESLQCLVDISVHPKLSTVLNHVIISLDRYRETKDFPGSDITTIHHHATNHRQGLYDQITLFTAGQHHVLLTQAFRNLHNLKTVGLRDFDNAKRFRDGEGAMWRAYGANKVYRRTGSHMAFRMDPIASSVLGSAGEFATTVFTSVLQALGNASTKPEALEILLRDCYSGLPDYAFNIPTYLEPMVLPLMTELKTLLLTLDIREDRHTPQHALRQFLLRLPNLRHLRLNFNLGRFNYHTDFMDWLAGDRDSNSQLLPKLERLDFGMLQCIDIDLLLRVVCRYAAMLKTVGFWKVGIMDNAEHTQGLAHTGDGTPKPRLWVELLYQLSTLVPGLQQISVGCPNQVFKRQPRKIMINFPFAARQGRDCVTRNYRQDDMRDPEQFRALLEKELRFEQEEFDDRSASSYLDSDDD